MGKRQIFSKISKWVIGILILAAFLAAGKQEKEGGSTNFFQIGKEVLKNSLTKQILYSQSMILGFLMEQEVSFWSPYAVMRTEGFFPYEETEKVVYLSPDMEEGIRKEKIRTYT